MSTRERMALVRFRVRLVTGAMVLALGVLGVQLWRLQVVRTSEFSSSLDHQSIRRVRLPGIRGKIYDRRGEVLADNRPQYCLAIYSEELRQRGRWSRTVDKIDQVIDELALVLGVDREVSRDDIARHVQRRLPLPFLAWRGLNEASMARWAESQQTFAGVDIYVEPERVYPQQGIATHVIGYVGRADPSAMGDNPYHYYLPEMSGREGIERSVDERLRGRAGGRLIRVDASGFKYEEKGELEPVAGEDIRLTLDLRIQAFAENILSNDLGAVVVMDPRQGEVLALASAPTYPVSALESRREWQAILQDPSRPLLNRAISGQYPPGSVFKPVVAITGLVHDRVNPNDTVNCPGYFQLGRQTFRCWLRRGHGPLNMRKAIEQSCNPYFCEIGLKIEYKRIYHMASSIGFGHRTGIELAGEARGLLPNDEWKRRERGDSWRPGDTCNVCMGQGALLVTPLQMAVFVSAVANGGKIYRPHLILDPDADSDSYLLQQMAWTPRQLAVIRGGMYDVIHEPSGTGKRALVGGIKMAGKTGTAQYGDGKKHTWMILYAPYDSPRYAVAMIVEDAVSGGFTVAPRIRTLMEYIFMLDGTLASPAGATLDITGGGA